MKIKKANTIALVSSYTRILIPNFDDVPEDNLNRNCCNDNSQDKDKSKDKDKSEN